MKRMSRAPLWAMVAALALIAAAFGYGALLYPHSATAPTGASLAAPSARHILGTDNLGIDIFAQLSRGFFLSLLTGLSAAAIAFSLGGALGVLAGYKGGAVRRAVDFGIHVFLSVPQLPMLIVLGAFWGQSRVNIILIVAAFSWAPIAKQVEAKTASVKDRPFVMLARSYGGSAAYVARTHLLPEIMPLLMVQSLMVVGRAILQESALAYLGLSDPLAKSWGLLINRAAAFPGIYFTNYWTWWLVAPVVALVTTTLLIRLAARQLEHQMLEGVHR